MHGGIRKLRLFLFDAPPSKEVLGKVLTGHPENYLGSTPFLLSGGIGPDSLSALRSFSHPALAGYDLNSRFEMRPGIKDTAKIKDFLKDLSCNEQN
jgi:phosphoribosylanthranilate isomerase